MNNIKSAIGTLVAVGGCAITFLCAILFVLDVGTSPVLIPLIEWVPEQYQKKYWLMGIHFSIGLAASWVAVKGAELAEPMASEAFFERE